MVCLWWLSRSTYNQLNWRRTRRVCAQTWPNIIENVRAWKSQFVMQLWTDVWWYTAKLSLDWLHIGLRHPPRVYHWFGPRKKQHHHWKAYKVSWALRRIWFEYERKRSRLSDHRQLPWSFWSNQIRHWKRKISCWLSLHLSIKTTFRFQIRLNVVLVRHV